MRRFLLFFSASFYLWSCSHAQGVIDNEVIESEDTSIIHEFDGAWAKKISYAYQEFTRENGDNWEECFSMLLVEFDDTNSDTQSVVFVPNDSIKIIDEKKEIVTFGRTECGIGISYRFDKYTGEFLKKILQR